MPKRKYSMPYQYMPGSLIFFLPGHVPSLKTSRTLIIRDGKPLSVPNKNVAKWMRAAVNHIKWMLKHCEENHNIKITEEITTPVKVYMYFIRANKRRFDYMNAAHAVLDSMVRAGLLPDDSANILTPVFAGHEVNKERPGVFVEIKWEVKL